MEEVRHLKEKARQIRLLVLEMIYQAQVSHIGTALSCVDILTALYLGNVLRIKPDNPSWPERDRFILSKGHGCSALYATLALKEFFPITRLQNFAQNGSILSGHVTLNCLPGVENSGGSGGHGLSLGAGMALAAKMDKRDSRTFVLVGDGECQEGSIWETIMFAAQHSLSNLTLIIDNNGLQIMGKTREIVDIEPLKNKLLAFNWDVVSCDGHSFSPLLWALSTKTDRPVAVIANTTKGKGVSFMENNYLWHGQVPNEEAYKKARKELENANHGN